MNKQQGSHRRLLAWMIFTTCVILATTTNYQNYGDNFSCGMRLGVGFPVAFLCDYAGGGGSPIDSWAKVDFADYPYFSLQGLLIDGSFDLIIAFSIARALHRYSRKDIHQLELYKQMYLITIVFAIGFFVASFIIKANQQIDLYRNYVFRHIQEHIPAPDFDLPGLLIGSLLSLIGAFVMVWTVHYIYRKDLSPFRPYKQIALITATLAIGFLFAVFIVNSNYENFLHHISRPSIPITTVLSPTFDPPASLVSRYTGVLVMLREPQLWGI